MLLSNEKDLAFLYFENKAQVPVISGLIPNKSYTLIWFDPITGKWVDNYKSISSNDKGNIVIEIFVTGEIISKQDWCLKIKLEN